MLGDRKLQLYEVTVVVTLEIEAIDENDARDIAYNEMPDGALGMYIEHIKDRGPAFE